MSEETMTDIQDDSTATQPFAGGHSRRRFFAFGAAAAATVFVAACGDDDDDKETGAGDENTTTTASEGGGGGGDAEIAAFAAGLELLAANTYGKAIEAATAGNLGEVPPAVVEFAKTAQSQHQAASDALAEAAGGITPEVPADIEQAVNEKFGQVTDVPGLGRFALEFEQQAADTYLDVIPKLESEAAINLTGSILPIARQRAAILHFVLGEYPVPETFAKADKSLAPS